jgi:hypothetical protein
MIKKIINLVKEIIGLVQVLSKYNNKFDLRKHLLFSEIKRMRKQVLPSLDIQKKKHALIIIFDLRLKYYREILLKELDYYYSRNGFENDAELASYMQDVSKTILQKSYSDAISMGIPVQLIDRVSAYHAPRIKEINQMIHDIIMSDFGKRSQDHKLYNVFSLILLSLFFAICDLEKHTCNINGDMDKYFKEFNKLNK